MLTPVNPTSLDRTSPPSRTDTGRTLDPALPEGVRIRVLRVVYGDPRAAAELLSCLTPRQAAGLDPLPTEPASLAPELLTRYRRENRALPDDTRLLLLLAAADQYPVATHAFLRAVAAGRLDTRPLEAAETAGVAHATAGGVVFRDAWTRIAAYETGSPADRRDVHRLLARVLRAEGETPRRSWHRGAGALGPSVRLTAELRTAAQQARDAGEHPLACALVERAAALSSDPREQSRLLNRAAGDAWQSGEGDRARRLAAATDSDALNGVFALRAGNAAEAFDALLVAVVRAGASAMGGADGVSCGGGAKADAAWGVAGRAGAALAEVARGEAGLAETALAEAARGEAARADGAVVEAARSGVVPAGGARTGGASAGGPRADVAPTEAARAASASAFVGTAKSVESLTGAPSETGASRTVVAPGTAPALRTITAPGTAATSRTTVASPMGAVPPSPAEPRITAPPPSLSVPRTTPTPRTPAPDHVVHLLARATEAAVYTGDLRRCREAAAVASRVGIVPHGTLGGLAAAFEGRYEDARDLLKAAAGRCGPGGDPTLLIHAGIAALMLGDHTRATTATVRAVASARARGATVVVAQAMEFRAYAEFWTGHPKAAESATADALWQAHATGQDNGACHLQAALAMFAALTGDADVCRERAAAARSYALGRGLGLPAALAQWALAYLDLSSGRFAAAAARLRALAGFGPGHGHRAIRHLATPHYVEAAVRSGDTRIARAAHADYDRWARAVRSPDDLALSARCRALLAPGDEAVEHYRIALDLHARGTRDFERARTELLFGAALRRLRRRTEARDRLHTSLEAFESFGAPHCAAQARAELRALGTPVAPTALPTPGALDPTTRLTAQQLMVARMAADGATNREIAVRLALSPRTIDHHLRGVFSRLGIRSRIELVRLLAEGEAS
ncbi:LuxR C-terminal-related transcriptional regulator [Streptomyces sp. NBC_00343]|uniref:LuxR C-terminal-related transcriptional regulator n=1 Tax=Streptomyces sp. NBC_00343 TaxID=2975719 RepID=UPI002E29A970|nr:LuxR C-terminal-related transcriptional regulator [Streptomyces sp. NBC_00343]